MVTNKLSCWRDWKTPPKSLSTSVLTHYSACLQEGKKRTISPHIYRAHTHWYTTKTISPIICMAKPIRPLVCEGKTWNAHESLKATRGSAFAQASSVVSGSEEQNASRSVSTCVTKHACLWLTGWKRLLWMPPFYSDTQLRPNWFGVHYRHVARQHPRPLCTCSLSSASPSGSISLICEQPKQILSQGA